jgi:hypothetical protein
MKRLFYSVFVTLLFSLSALAQNEGINFQGVARNTAGEVLVSQKINLRLSILLGSETGTVAYMETRQVTTNPQGVFAVVVGDDKALTKSTNFSAINWTPSPKFIKVEMDPNAGSSYLVMGTSRLQAVPFAFYANGVDANNVKGVLPVSSGGTGVATISDLKTSLGLDQVNNAALDSKVDKVAGKELSTNDYTTAEKNKLAAISGTNTGDQDLSGYATTAQLATKANSADVTTSLATKANTTDVTTSLATKANTADVTTSLATKANASDVTTSLATKANTADVTTSLATKANTADVTTSLATKVDKVTGKDLSTNDYTTAEKTKLAAITGTNTGDQVNITGNAGTATKLQSSVTINGVAFDGSANITLPTSSAGIPYTGATQAADLGAFDLKVNGLTVGRGLNGNTDSNIAIGKDVLRSVTGGSYLTAVGHEALYSNTSGYNNTAIGSAALNANTTGLANTAVGSNSLQSNTTANFVTAVGNHALRNNTTGGNNTAVGSGALEFNSTGELNSAFGYDALKKNTTGIRNTAVGVNALVDNTTGSGNAATGFSALLRNTTGYNNTATGQYSLALNTTGYNNTALGESALYPNTTGYNNTAVGQGALKNNSTGFDNSALGEGTLGNNTTGKYNSGFGRESLHRNSSGEFNTGLGWRAGFETTTGNNNTAIGRQAGNANTTGSNNTAIGAEANFGANNLTNATAIGFGAIAAASNTIQLGNTAVTDVITSGSITTGKDIIVSGVIVGRGTGNVPNNNNVAIGTRGLAGTGSANTAVGNDALIANTTGANNVSIGSGSLFTNTTGTSNVAIGHLALWKNTIGINNTANGREALKEFVGSNNTAIGYRALFGSSGASTGTSNTAVGSSAGINIRNGSNNIVIGGGDGVETGSFNTLIGVNARVSTASFSSATVIGYNAMAQGDNSTAIGNGAIAAANTIRLGNSTVSSIGGQVAWTAASDSRIKKNIVNSTYGLATVLKLRPVEYNLTSNDLKQVGFIAQEVQKLVPEVVTGKEGDLSKGEILGITYSNLVPVLTKAIQEQQKQIEDQNAKIAAQQKQIEELIKLVKGQ